MPEFYELLGLDMDAVEVVGVVWYGIAKRQMPYPFRKLHVDDVLSSLP